MRQRSGGTGQVYRDLRQPPCVQTHGYSVEVDRLWWQVLLSKWKPWPTSSHTFILPLCSIQHKDFLSYCV